MSANDENLPREDEFTEEVDLNSLSRESVSNIFSQKSDPGQDIEEPSKPTFNPKQESPDLKQSPRGSRGVSFLLRAGKLNPLGNWIGKRKARQEELTLGIDLSKPTKEDEELDPPSAFQELLTPLSDSELVLLQKDVQRDENVYVRINKARISASNKQRWAILLTSLFAIFYFWTLGASYLTEILPQANNTWLPEALGADIREKIVFALGLLLPFLGILVLSEGLRLVFVGIFDRVPIALFRGITTLCLAIAALILISSGQVFLTGTILVLWWVFKKIIEHPLFRKITSRRESN